MNINDYKDIPVEKFTLVQQDSSIHDTKFETKPIGYLKDAWIRFKKNQSSVVAAIIIALLIIFAICVPVFSKYSVTYMDTYYANVLPKCDLFAKFGFWNGVKTYKLNQQAYDCLKAIPDAVVKERGVVKQTFGRKTSIFYKVDVDTYNKVGYKYMRFSKKEYDDILKYQKETGKNLLYPIVDESKVKCPSAKGDANFWYLHDMKGKAILDDNGEFQPILKKDSNGEYTYYIPKMGGNQYQVRVLYKDYYTYINGHEPSFLFGSDIYGQDILVRLASGARLSMILGFCVALINICIGAVVGSLEGYYGGYVDLIIERIIEIIGGVPFIILVTLFNIHFSKKVGSIVCLLFAFIFSGWIGPASRMRSQFYRFKGQEYVLAARTLGAKDSRLIFKHILPNSLGTFITSVILIIPGVIFAESTLSYLGIVDLESGTMTSVGTLLNNAKSSLSTFPHELFFPAGFISLMMISFNLFGNGLRDAFNPSLRGAEE